MERIMDLKARVALTKEFIAGEPRAVVRMLHREEAIQSIHHTFARRVKFPVSKCVYCPLDKCDYNGQRCSILS